ncbi:MAG: serine protease [Lachnospiraceae bacterium]|nr:serine protease [Lachnospiraceae bacterium]
MKENQDRNEPSQASDFEFLQEKIKERPINKKKLIQRTIITASLALLFGLIACLTFLLLEPVLNNWLYPEEEPIVVTFPQEKDEMRPEDMLTEDETTQEETESEESVSSSENVALVDTPQESSTEENEEENLIAGYEDMYQSIRELYQEVATSMVTVTGVKSDVDWFNNPYESEGTIAGVVIANNNRELLILTKRSPLKGAESIHVTFFNGTIAEGSIKKYDVNTDLAVIAVELKYLSSNVLKDVSVAKLASSNDVGLQGIPVMAVGNIFGYKDSVSYGMITSMGNIITLADNQYKLITTDIYGSKNPTGILVNMEGRVLGMLDNTHNNEDTANLVSAIGITELKGMITKLSNGADVPYAGLYVQDISSDARLELGLPKGAYISNMDMNSPAMKKGIQKGDILIRVGDKEINTAADYMNAIRGYSANREITITVLRSAQEEYEEMEFVVELQARE